MDSVPQNVHLSCYFLLFPFFPAHLFLFHNNMDIGQLENPFKSKKKHSAKTSPDPYQIGDYDVEQPSSAIPVEKKSTRIANKVKDEIHKAKNKAHSYHHHHDEQTKDNE